MENSNLSEFWLNSSELGQHSVDTFKTAKTHEKGLEIKPLEIKPFFIFFLTKS